jgi:hypothetical protein
VAPSYEAFATVTTVVVVAAPMLTVLVSVASAKFAAVAVAVIAQGPTLLIETTPVPATTEQAGDAVLKLNVAPDAPPVADAVKPVG